MEHVLQFRIELLGISPPIWRRIQVPPDCTFWDLHVAIQDAMGWEDQHLHAFRVVGSEATYGIPDPEGDEEVLSGAATTVDSALAPPPAVATYEYDFGDGWVHLVVMEAYEPSEAGASYPRCVDGERACPPEDSGGPHMFAEALRAREDRDHPDRETFATWLDPGFDPEAFDVSAVRFTDPKKRWARLSL